MEGLHRYLKYLIPYTLGCLLGFLGTAPSFIRPGAIIGTSIVLVMYMLTLL